MSTAPALRKDSSCDDIAAPKASIFGSILSASGPNGVPREDATNSSQLASGILSSQREPSVMPPLTFSSACKAASNDAPKAAISLRTNASCLAEPSARAADKAFANVLTISALLRSLAMAAPFIQFAQRSHQPSQLRLVCAACEKVLARLVTILPHVQ